MSKIRHHQPIYIGLLSRRSRKSDIYGKSHLDQSVVPTHTHLGSIALRGPLKWSVTTACCNGCTQFHDLSCSTEHSFLVTDFYQSALFTSKATDVDSLLQRHRATVIATCNSWSVQRRNLIRRRCMANTGNCSAGSRLKVRVHCTASTVGISVVEWEHDTHLGIGRAQIATYCWQTVCWWLHGARRSSDVYTV